MTLALPGICRALDLVIDSGGFRYGKQDLKFRIVDRHTGESWGLVISNQDAERLLVETERLVHQKQPMETLTLSPAERAELAAYMRAQLTLPAEDRLAWADRLEGKP